MTAHAFLSASGAHRWLNCPASPHLEAQFPDKGSAFAALGTAAHALAEQLLINGGDVADVETDLPGDVKDAVQFYLDFARARIAEVQAHTPDAVVLIEERLDFSHLVPEGFGTGDLVIIADRVLDIADYKNGQGVKVEAFENEQMGLYGLGAIDKFGMLYDFDTVRMTIIQPRLSREPSVWESSVADLVRWGEEVVKPAAALAFSGEGGFHPGEHCGFCRAKHQCRARAEANLAEVAGEFSNPELLTDDEIGALLAVAGERQKWYGEIQSYALERAEKGHRWPGYKLVEGRANRKYLDQDRVVTTLTGAGFAEALLFERSLLGITAMEKVVGKKKFSELLGELVVKPKGKPTLVPSSDPRQEIDGGSAIDGFDEISDPV